MAVVRNLSPSSKMDVWTIDSSMKKPTDIDGSRWLPRDRMSKMDWLYGHLARVPGVSYSLVSLLLLNSIKNWIAIQFFPARTARYWYCETAEEFDSVLFGWIACAIRLPPDLAWPMFIFSSRNYRVMVALFAFLSLAAVMLRCWDFFFNLRRVNHGIMGSWPTCAPTRVTFDYPVFITFRMHGFPSPKQLLQNSVPSSYHSNGPPLPAVIDLTYVFGAQCDYG